jgi:hypothetical protein
MKSRWYVVHKRLTRDGPSGCAERGQARAGSTVGAIALNVHEPSHRTILLATSRSSGPTETANAQAGSPGQLLLRRGATRRRRLRAAPLVSQCLRTANPQAQAFRLRSCQDRLKSAPPTPVEKCPTLGRRRRLKTRPLEGCAG